MKKIYLLILIILSFFIINVCAKEKDFTLSSVSIDEKVIQ